jgi:hypothetical protein
MNLRPITGAVVFVVLAGAMAGPVALAVRDNEEDLRARLQNEHNPVKRAKYKVRLGQIKLEQARVAYDQGNVDAGVKLLDAYLGCMKEAWQALRSSGRNAARQPQGFKELDIALREDVRLLGDVAHRVSFYDREPVKKVTDEIEGIRSQVLHALFPAARPPSAEDKPVRPNGLVQSPRRGIWWAAPAGQLPGRMQDILSDEEDEKVREAQDPSDRIQVYIEFTQTRLENVDEWRQKPADAQLDVSAYLAKMMDQYITLTDEMKNWIDYQFDREGDMRRGLRKLLEAGPHQLQELRRIQESPGPYAADYRKSLGEAIDDLSDALDGATKALQTQQKKFGELKKEEKADAKAEKVREKDEKKREKEEKKLRKQEEKKHHVPSDEDEN